MTSIIQVNTKEGRLYQTPVGLLPSVTTILRATMPQSEQHRLDKWRQQQITDEAATTDTRNKAASRETKIHELIAAQLQGQPQDCPEELLEFWNPVRKVVAALTKPLAIEQVVYHPTLKYAGTLDLVASWQDRLTIIDWKTSHRAKRFEWMGDAAIQVAAYKAAFEKLFEIEVEQAAVVVISPNRVQLFEIHIAQYWDTWLQRLEAYYSQGEN